MQNLILSLLRNFIHIHKCIHISSFYILSKTLVKKKSIIKTEERREVLSSFHFRPFTFTTVPHSWRPSRKRKTRFATASLEQKIRKVKNCLPWCADEVRVSSTDRRRGVALKAARKLDLSARSDGAISCWKQRTERRSTTIFQRQRRA